MRILHTGPHFSALCFTMSSQIPTDIVTRIVEGLFIGVILDNFLVSYSFLRQSVTERELTIPAFSLSARGCDCATLHLLAEVCKVS